MTREPLRIEMPMYPETGPVNAYLFTAPEVVLVDTGPATAAAWDALGAGLADHGVTVGDISRVIITHPHHDHYAQAGRIAAESAAQVWIGEVGAPWLLDDEAVSARRMAYYRDEFLPGIALDAAEIDRVLAGMRAVQDSITPISAGRLFTFAAGTTLTLGGAPWTVLHTPGHASAQTIFYQPDTRRLLASDMLLPITPTPVVEAPPAGATRLANLPQYLDSLARVEALDVERVYPGHWQPFGDHRALIQFQRERIALRKQECLGHIEAGCRTLAELFAAMYGDRDAARAGLAALWMLVGYTDLLLAEERIICDVVDRVWHFRAAM